MVIIDPPFITREVWEKYAATTKLLLLEETTSDREDHSKANCILLSTIAENEAMMKELLQVNPVAFQPSIPNLVYQYNLYTNYNSERLAKVNEEIPQ
jgi:hypothetical protein